MKVKSKSQVAQSCLTLRDSMDCSLPGSSTHGLFQARVLEWGAIDFSKIQLGLCISEVSKEQYLCKCIPFSEESVTHKKVWNQYC